MQAYKNSHEISKKLKNKHVIYLGINDVTVSSNKTITMSHDYVPPNTSPRCCVPPEGEDHEFFAQMYITEQDNLTSQTDGDVPNHLIERANIAAIIVGVKNDLEKISQEISENAPRVDKLLKNVDHLAKQTSGIPKFSKRLADTDAKFTRKINGLDRRVKKIVSYGNVIDNMNAKINEITVQSDKSYSLFQLIAWMIYGFLFFGTFFSIFFTLILFNEGLIHQDIIGAACFSALVSIIPIAVTIFFNCMNL